MKQNSNRLLVAVACLLLSGCTFFRPPGHGLPDRSTISAGEEITVERGQNVYGIARQYGVSMREVIALNELKPPFIIRPGQRLLLPAKDRDMAPVPMAAPMAGIETRPVDAQVPPGFSDSVTAVPLDAPKAEAAPELRFQPQPPSQASTPPMALTAFSPPPAPKAVKTTVAEEGVLKVPEPKEAETKPVKTEAPVAPKTNISFTWPVQGPVVSGFGPKGQGTNNDGINITAPKGAPVLAAAGGIVVYAGNEMKGFGNLLLIRHEGGWVTAYAHLDRIMVTRDTVVAPGDMIGTVGSTGGVSTPQLHFETRYEGKPIDPQTVIKKS